MLALEWAMWFNTHDSFTYRYTFGDKNTFRAAFILANAAASYYQVSVTEQHALMSWSAPNALPCNCARLCRCRTWCPTRPTTAALLPRKAPTWAR